MATLTANEFAIPSGAASGGKQAMISFDGLLIDDTTKKIILNPNAVAGGDLEVNSQTSGKSLVVDVSQERVGIGIAVPDNTLHVFGKNSGKTLLEGNSSTTNVVSGILDILSSTSANMVNGFGDAINFRIKDPGANERIARIVAVRAGADDKGKLELYAGTDGLTIGLTVENDGNVSIEQQLNPTTYINVSGQAHIFLTDDSDTDTAFGIFDVKHKTDGNMADGFGGHIQWRIEDVAGVNNRIGRVGFVMDGADNEGKFIISAGTDGLEEFLTIDSSGFVQIENSLRMNEITTPAALTNYGAIYPKLDNKLYFQDGAGVEHEVAFV